MARRMGPALSAFPLRDPVSALTHLVTRSISNYSRQAAFAREDVNHDGRVDILDAFALARQLKAGAARATRFDINGDGVVDERDVASIAARAVRLEKGGHS